MRSLKLGATVAAYSSLDVYLLQDTSGSYIDDLPNVKANLADMMEAIHQIDPDSQFGIGQFRDKPYHNLGELSDFCYRLVSPLTTDSAELQTRFSQVLASGGRDYPEAQLHAIIAAAHDENLGWREGAMKLIVISTDAKPHNPQDYLVYPETAPAYMKPFPDHTIADISSDDLCRDYDYPSLEQLKSHLEKQGVLLGIMTPVDDPEVMSTWSYINDEFLNNPSAFYQFIETDSSNILDIFNRILAHVQKHMNSS